MIQLYPDQVDVLDRTRAAYQRGRRAPLIVAPTGWGKAIAASYTMAGVVTKGGRPLFIADRCTLLDQLVAKLAMAGITDPRVIQADRDEGPPGAAATVASAPTLRMPGWVDRLPEATFLLWDEAHHCSANTYSALLQRYPTALKLGFTATPLRGDNRPLDMFDELVVGPSVAELTALGRLAPCRVVAPQPLRSGELAQTPLDAWRLHAAGRRAAIFRNRVSEAQQDVADFRAAGLRAAVVTAATKGRADILAAFADGEYDALASVGTLIEGWDDPGCAVAIVACQPSLGRWLQICGRVLRYQPGKQALVIDLGGMAREHGHPAEERAYSLDGQGISTLPRDVIRQCPSCGSIAPGRPTLCPYCGAAWPLSPRRPGAVVGAELSEVVPTTAPRREYVVTITAKRGGTCVHCGRGIRSGDKIFWATQARQARHEHCPAVAA